MRYYSPTIQSLVCSGIDDDRCMSMDQNSFSKAYNGYFACISQKCKAGDVLCMDNCLRRQLSLPPIEYYTPTHTTGDCKGENWRVVMFIVFMLVVCAIAIRFGMSK